MFVLSGARVDPYFYLLMSNPSVGWCKVWFFLRNDADALLPMFTGIRPFVNPNGGTVWPRRTSAYYNPYVMSSIGCCKEGGQAQTTYEPLLAIAFNHFVSEK
jgi:hypothetical protein